MAAATSIITNTLPQAKTKTMSSDLALLRLLQLVSPALPVGAYAYSQGMEYAVDSGWLTNETQARDWIIGLLRYNQTYLDVPVLARLYQAWQQHDQSSVQYWNAYLYATREAKELQQEDYHLGTALARLLLELDIGAAADWIQPQRCCFATVFALAATHWQITLNNTATGYLWAWTENQVAAAIKLIPLGQTAAQRVLSAAMPEINSAVSQGLTLEDDEIGASATGLSIASALHETQYSRLFRS